MSKYPSNSLLVAPFLAIAMVSSAGAADPLNENFDTDDGAFTVTSESHDDPWAYDAGAGAWSTDGSANGAADEHTRLTSPELTVDADGSYAVIFDHRYDIEGDDWDGAALFISVNGGSFDYVEGAKFTENGYNTGNLIGAHALVGLTAFGGISPGHADGTYITSTAGPFPFSSGDKIQIQFLMANDQGAVGTMTPNWEIDSVQVVSLVDTDNDGIPDFYEEANGLDPNDPADAALDLDLDGCSNLKEFQNGTDPQDSDSDDDGLLDGVETGTGTFVDENDTGTNPKSADTDGDGLADGVEDPRESFVDADQPGTDPNNSDSDGDSFADLTEITLGSDPTNAASAPQTGTIVIVGEVDEFLGPDDLNLDPSVVIAVDTFGDADRLVNGVTFQADGPTNGAGTVTNGPVSVTTSAANQINGWAGAPAFTGADPTSATNLGEIMRDIRWEAAPAPLTVDISGLFPGTVYEIQLLFNEGADRDRHWDIGVEGELVVDNITSEGHADPGGTVWTPNNSFRYIAEFEAPADGILNIVMQQHIGGQEAMGADNNPILQAVIVRITDQRPFEITQLTYDGTGATLTWNSRPGASYALDFSTDLTEGSWTEIDDGIISQGEETTFTDTATPPGRSTLFYRVRSLD
jgi:hypothetical protein